MFRSAEDTGRSPPEDPALSLRQRLCPRSRLRGGRPILWAVSTRTLIVLALLCGIAVLVAFAVQVLQVI